MNFLIIFALTVSLHRST